MIVPSSLLPPSGSPGLLTQDNQPKPDPVHLLMAAAEMHKLGRLAPSGPKARSRKPALREAEETD